MLDFTVGYVPLGYYYIGTQQYVIGEKTEARLTPASSAPANNMQVIALKTGEMVVEAKDEGKGDGKGRRMTPTVTVYFKKGTAVPINKPQFDDLSGSSVAVKGYASPEGSDGYNMALSRKRAEAAAVLAKKAGAKVERVEYVGERPCQKAAESDYEKCRKAVVTPIKESR